MSNLLDDYMKAYQSGVKPTLNQTVEQPKQVIHKPNDTGLLKDEFLKEHKKNGLFERFYNFLKNKTNFGFGSKNVEFINNKVNDKLNDIYNYSGTINLMAGTYTNAVTGDTLERTITLDKNLSLTPIYTAKTNTKYTDSPKGFVHIFENTAFSKALREKIPTSQWNQKLFLSLGSNTLYKNSHISVAENFIKKIEELPPDKLKKMSKPFFQMIKNDV